MDFVTTTGGTKNLKVTGIELSKQNLLLWREKKRSPKGEETTLGVKQVHVFQNKRRKGPKKK